MRLRLLILVSIFAVLIAGCGGPPPRGDSELAEGGETPQLTQTVIEERINDAYVFDVKPESGSGDPIFWNFDEDEPKEITVVEREDRGDSATLVLDIKTQNAPKSRLQRRLEGRIKTEWRLRTGWVLRRWEIEYTENISMKYRDLPKPESSNSNSNANK